MRKRIAIVVAVALVAASAVNAGWSWNDSHKRVSYGLSDGGL